MVIHEPREMMKIQIYMHPDLSCAQSISVNDFNFNEIETCYSADELSNGDNYIYKENAALWFWALIVQISGAPSYNVHGLSSSDSRRFIDDLKT